MLNGASGAPSCPRCDQEEKQAERQLALLHERLAAREVEHQRSLAEARAELLSRNEKLLQQLEAVTREKDGMVVRYATSEKEVIVVRKALDEADKRLRDLAKERDQYFSRVRSLSQERSRLCTSLDTKLAELARLHKEQERLRDDLASRDIKIKWAQNKLRTEVDAHKETQGRLEQALLRLRDLREEADQVRKDCHEMLRREGSPDNHRDELEQLRQQLEGSLHEKHVLTAKVEQLEQERSEQEQMLARLKQELDDKSALEVQLAREHGRAEASQAEAERLGQAAAEAQADLEACHQKEAELLLFTQQLTSRSVQLQSDHSLLSLKLQGLEEDKVRLEQELTCAQRDKAELEANLEREKRQRHHETQLLARKLADKCRAADKLTVRLEEADNEQRVMQRRHLSSVKELARELQHVKRQLERQQEAASTQDAPSPEPQPSSQPQVGFVNTGRHDLLGSAGPEAQPDVQLLLERIVRLQKSLARKKDKLDFLEEHVGHLVLELKNKSRIIQNYVAREEAGALIPSSMDCNKEELARRGGIMASVFGSQPLDAGMTLELSLEMNRKLQLVLEDTLLKNITLKESMDTLGQEIARLTRAGSAPVRPH